ncbi:Dabb family protein [Cryobacterium sp. TMT1-62]|uniref:Dabb family protein n=1 Tax=Cryobacterium sandaracinum TaxID=1259247 RepID=A0ABY2J1L7_9MICO|nr:MULTISPECIES: Dabb family protein [Cryobacterium]TFB56553.1 Dabb family protein [Cryobacterium sp. Sr3]TFC40025.1 Dabb family protein [Cryobacterium sp. TMT2-14]TFC48812.1 Dabb family protein [Cryobacterium sp. TMT2-17-1]TFC69911.1 Dabb family protein [Cryobacterium sp. TMT2-4]TFC98827.1 Dabb family protein [Cryobacterium sandaracinum]
MIRHIVSWQLAPADPVQKAAAAAGIAVRLEGLVGVVDEIRSLQVGFDVAGGSNWDVVLIADFDDLDAVNRYQVHPAHQAAGTFIRSVVSSRMAVDVAV